MNGALNIFNERDSYIYAYVILYYNANKIYG